MAKPKKTAQSREEILEKKRQKERERYARIKSDPIKLAAYKEKDKQKYLKERATGVRKTIKEMTEREKRQCRKSWRARSCKYYKKKCAAKKATEDFLRANTPSSMCDEYTGRNSPAAPIPSPQVHIDTDLLAASSPRLRAARQKSIIQRRKRNKELKEKDNQIKKLKSKLSKYRKKVSKLQKEKENLKNPLTPNSKMTQMAENPITRADVVKKAIFGDTIEQQISENLNNLKTTKEKEVANKLLLGSVVEKTKLWKTRNKVVSYKKIWQNKNKNKKEKSKSSQLAKLIESFLEDDKYSRIGAGKKEYIKRKNIKKQKRYRLDTLRNLHKEYLKSGQAVISYSMFARLTPFWIVSPKVTDRDTCMCTIHGNIQLIVTALKNAKVLEVASHQNLLTALCCDRYNEQCLNRTCERCSTTTIPLCKEFDKTMPVKYQKWEGTREIFMDPKTKKERTVIKQKKNTLDSSAGDLVQKLEKDLEKLFKHETNIVHQYQHIKKLKESLTENDAVIHMDFSENYAGKYNEEIQSFHFGGSRMQLSLHTVVVYLKMSIRSYCTVSKNLSHNVYAIWAHLRSVLDELPANIETVHFLSDGPVTQYRNKLMFYVLACKLPEMWPQFMHWTWNYHEAGHGKGAPDGVGATCKRTADKVVAMGGDICNLAQFCGAVQDRCPNITLYIVTDAEIEDMEKILYRDQPSLLPFQGTLQVHQVQGNAYFPSQVVMKALSCFCEDDVCEHYRLGIIKYSTIKAHVNDIFSDPDTEGSNDGSTSILKTPDISELVDLTDLPMDMDMNGLDIDPKDLFPEKKELRVKKRKINEENVMKRGKKRNNNTEKIDKTKKLKHKTKNKRRVKQKKEASEEHDCSCVICGALYEEDISGQDWIQCILCRQWAQVICIKTDPISFTCPECLPDGDYEPHISKR